MAPKSLAIAVVCSACGQVAAPSVAIDAAPDSPPMPISYRGTLAATAPPVDFGGGPAPACTFTAVFKQIDLTLGILPSGQVVSGQAQALYVEGVVTQCMYTPADPSIINFAFRSASGTTGLTLAFDEKMGDKPGASLTAVLTPSGTSFQAALTFHRTDLGPPLAWTVTAMFAVAPQP